MGFLLPWEGPSWLRCSASSSQWLLLLGGAQALGTQVSAAAARRLWSVGSVVVGLRCFPACGLGPHPWTRDGNCDPCIDRQILIYCTTREQMPCLGWLLFLLTCVIAGSIAGETSSVWERLLPLAGLVGSVEWNMKQSLRQFESERNKKGWAFMPIHHRRKMHKVNSDCRITISEDTTGLLLIHLGWLQALFSGAGHNPSSSNDRDCSFACGSLACGSLCTDSFWEDDGSFDKDCALSTPSWLTPPHVKGPKTYSKTKHKWF